MPRTKQNRKYGKKRVYKSKRRYGRKLALSSLNTLSPLPSKYICKHKYVSHFDIDPTTQTYNFNLNSLYDPDRTSGTNHQPYAFDNLALLYEKYRVISCSWVINGINPASPGKNIRLACNPHNDNVSFSNMNLLLESPRTRYVIQGAQGSPLKTLKGKAYIPSIVGRTKAQYMADDKYGSSAAGSPSELAILTVMGSDLEDLTATAIACNITLEFVVEWYDVRQLTQS